MGQERVSPLREGVCAGEVRGGTGPGGVPGDRERGGPGRQQLPPALVMLPPGPKAPPPLFRVLLRPSNSVPQAEKGQPTPTSLPSLPQSASFRFVVLCWIRTTEWGRDCGRPPGAPSEHRRDPGRRPSFMPLAFRACRQGPGGYKPAPGVGDFKWK